MALFSSKALGNLDPPPWTNSALRPSPTDIRTAQVPDPSWEWAWPEWRINYDEGTDEGGWQYSFMFYKKFSWHKPKWYNSFVRRRAWIRRRVKREEDGLGFPKSDPHLLNPEYFTIQPAEARRSSSIATSRASISQASMVGTELDGEENPDIEDMETLLRVLRAARIDREKIEAVDSFLKHGKEELVHLQDEMHEIMSLFVFQASRRILLSLLAQAHSDAVKARDADKNPESQGLVDSLSAAVKHADEEVAKLEYWSDVKAMAENQVSQDGPSRPEKHRQNDKKDA